MHRSGFAWLWLVVLLVCVSWAGAHWDATFGEPNYMPPAMWNVQQVFIPGFSVCLEHAALADDWLAKENGPVTDIHFWVGFWEDDIPWTWVTDPNLILENTTWNIAIYSSILSSCGQLMAGPWLPAWSYTPGMADISIRHIPLQGQWVRDWHCPDTPYSQQDDHAGIYQINITNIKMPMIQTQNECYWLVMSAECVDPCRPIGEERPVIGWCTSNEVPPYMGSVAKYRDAQSGNWLPIMIGSGVNPPFAGSMCDMSFVITGGTLDYGDAPDNYKTLNVSNGARHHIDTTNPNSNICLGNSPMNLDAENDGIPSVNADGDDLSMMDDEDGVTFLAPLTRGGTAQARIMVFDGSMPGYRGKLNAWMDFNRDGDFDDAGEQVITCRDMVMGMNLVTIPIPAGASLGDTYARFRYSRVCHLPSYGQAPDGEVEDYKVTIVSKEGDLNVDGNVDVLDLQIFVAHWLQGGCLPDPSVCGGADINGDGWVTLLDFSRMANNWLN